MYIRLGEYGHGAILGRPLSVREARALTVVSNVRAAVNSRNAYRDKDGDANWPEWADRHPELNEILARAIEAAESEDDAI